MPILTRWNESQPREKEFLTPDELDRITQKEFSITGLTHLHDIFVFCYYTGLSYADVRKPQKTDIAKDRPLAVYQQRGF